MTPEKSIELINLIADYQKSMQECNYKIDQFRTILNQKSYAIDRFLEDNKLLEFKPMFNYKKCINKEN
jgi:hypothetical protein